MVRGCDFLSGCEIVGLTVEQPGFLVGVLCGNLPDLPVTLQLPTQLKILPGSHGHTWPPGACRNQTSGVA